MQVVSPPGGGFADVCTLAAGIAPAGLVAHQDTALFCDGSVAREAVARYVLQVEGGAKARIKLLSGDLAGALPAIPSEVTVNGGCELKYSPLPIGVEISQVGGNWIADVSGADLDRVVSAAYRAGSATTALEIVSRSPERLTVQAGLTQVPGDGFLELIDEQGFAGTLAAEGGRLLPWAADRVLVRFSSGEVEPGLGLPDGPTALFRFRSPQLLDSLTVLGVSRLQRLLPWFRHADVNSMNLLGEPVVLEDLADLYLAEVAPGSDIMKTIGRLQRISGVRYACPDYVLRLTEPPPNDPLFGDQWGLRNTGQTPCGYPGLLGRDIAALNAWDFEHGTLNTRVAILDSGILMAHPDLTPRVVLDTSFVDASGGSDDSSNRHGTGVAGIVASTTGNAEGVAGIARGVSLWSMKVCSGSNCDMSKVILAIDRARMKGVPIVNMSLGSPIPACPSGQSCPEAMFPLNEACLNAYLSGVFLVASSGNADVHYNDFSENLHPLYPAAYHRRVFAVGAFMNDGRRWKDSDIAPGFCSNPSSAALYCRSSNYSPGDPWLDVVAPGGRYIVTTRDTALANRYHTLTGCIPGNLASNTAFGGTSAAAPVVSGLAALLKSKHFDLTGDDFEQIIIRTTVAPVIGYDYPVGYGRVRADAALGRISVPNVVVRDSLRASALELTVADSTVLYGRRFIEVFEDPNQDYTTSCVRYRLRGTWAFDSPFMETPWAWIRGSGTLGWRDTVVYDQRYEVPGGKVISISADSAVFETNVYRILDSQDPTITLGWYPCTPAAARIGCTAVGLRGVVAVEERTRGAGFEVVVRPNPVRRQAWIDLALPRAGIVDLEVFDLAGRRVATLLRGPLGAGSHTVSWNGRSARPGDPRSGVYYLRCGFGGREIVRRLVLLGVDR